MAIKFEKIQPGMVLYERGSTRMGNTTLRTISEWSVRIISVDAATRTAVVSWNGNRETTYYERDLRKMFDWSMYDECAEVKRGMCDSVVKVTKKKAAKVTP